MNRRKTYTEYESYYRRCSARGWRPISLSDFEAMTMSSDPNRQMRFIGWGATLLWCVCIVAAFVWLSGCSAAGDEPAVVTHPQPVLALSGDAEIDAALVTWSSRWENATGVPVLFARNGAPVRRSDDGMSGEVDAVSGQLDCAETVQMYDAASQWVSSLTVRLTRPEGCPDTSTIIGHELGHVLGGYEAQHSASGVFQAYIGADDSALVIDEASLASVCAHLRCLTFKPER